MNREVRIPIQKRSIAKRKKIIDTANKIFNDRGYFNTNTAEIAKEAGLATGSVYAYFKDKKDIFLEVSDMYARLVYNNTIKNLNKIKEKKDLKLFVKTIINSIIEKHKLSPRLHKEITMLASMDSEIKDYYAKQEQLLINKYLEKLKEYNLNYSHSKEKLFMVHSLIEEMCHEIIYNDKSNLDKNILIGECTKAVHKILE
ncbi:TetR/AcrR family transcriptional regulator [Clostridium sp.]|jgi:AcrR family transcriptional regulator|uniref:TetR/AcrR family transcriptional regulator n=1 Tax=Clostridium sp. TaxID=1506 RepID=UPI00258FC57F|nr:TetR/AcrR family transcriptional regulator [Clostridium sp.]MDF2504685.1 transcriptional regulator, TetR family protein [Clostridium sp.]